MNIGHEILEFDRFNELRIQFLNHIAETSLPVDISKSRPTLIVVTHLLPDRPAFLSVLGRYFEIGHVFGIPYSTTPGIAGWVARHFPVSEPTLSQLLEGACIERELVSSPSSRIILMDIGGYAAAVIKQIHEKLGGRLCGV